MIIIICCSLLLCRSTGPWTLCPGMPACTFSDAHVVCPNCHKLPDLPKSWIACTNEEFFPVPAGKRGIPDYTVSVRTKLCLLFPALNDISHAKFFFPFEHVPAKSPEHQSCMVFLTPEKSEQCTFQVWLIYSWTHLINPKICKFCHLLMPLSSLISPRVCLFPSNSWWLSKFSSKLLVQVRSQFD